MAKSVMDLATLYGCQANFKNFIAHFLKKQFVPLIFFLILSPYRREFMNNLTNESTFPLSSSRT